MIASDSDDSAKSPSLPAIRLKTERRSSHPWIFQKTVEKPKVRLRSGSVVDILDRNHQWVGRGFYNGHSRIGLRVLTTNPAEAIDADFFRRKLERAIQLRREVLRLDEVTDAYRLVHSESDGLSGLVVDRFGSLLVLEFFSAGMFRFREVVKEILLDFYRDSQFYWFAEEHVQKQESFTCHAPEAPRPTVITEHGLRFRVAPGSKHKTGFFLDQRDNRRRLADYCRNKRVLDLCCNTGGFAVYAKALGRANDVTGIDLDQEALELAGHNANLNKSPIRFLQADLFTWLRDIRPSVQQFDVVVLDPSKQTRDRDSVRFALRRYADMNRLALQAIVPGGLFLTCSCTGLIREQEFLDMLRTAAWQAERNLQVLQVAGAAPDHPFFVHAQESRYLKVALCRVFPTP